MKYTLVPMDRSHLAGVAELERLCFATPARWERSMGTKVYFMPWPPPNSGLPRRLR